MTARRDGEAAFEREPSNNASEFDYRAAAKSYSRWELSILATILICSSIWCIGAAWRLGTTFDETIYIEEGLQLWRTGSHAGLLRQGIMPLPADIETLPLYVYENWHGKRLEPARDWLEMLRPARIAALLFWWILLVYGWMAGRRLGGQMGGLLAAAFLALEPTMLAHASLATTDVPLTAGLLAMLHHFEYSRRSTRAWIAGTWFGVALLSKASAALFGPLALVAVEIERLARSPSGGIGAFERTRLIVHRLRPFWRELMKILLLGSAIAIFVCGSDWQREPGTWWVESLSPGFIRHVLRWVVGHLPIFPNAIDGLMWQVQHNAHAQGANGAYLLGRTAESFWYYFPVALTIKLSIALLVLPIAIAVIMPSALLNWPNLAAATLLTFSPWYRVQIGIRLILPIVALLSIGVAASTVTAIRASTLPLVRRSLTVAAGAGLVSAIYSAIAVWPNALCFTNALWGGTEQGYKYLADSNYDWGQGLPELADWERTHSATELDVWYFGNDPAASKLPIRILPYSEFTEANVNIASRMKGRYLAVSANLLYGAPYQETFRDTVKRLRQLEPASRTSTFFIYDFTK